MWLPKPRKREPYQHKPGIHSGTPLICIWVRELHRTGLNKEAMRVEVARHLWRAGKALERGKTTKPIGGVTAFEAALIIMCYPGPREADTRDCWFNDDEPRPTAGPPDLREAVGHLFELAWYVYRLHGRRRQTWYGRVDEYLAEFPDKCQKIR